MLPNPVFLYVEDEPMSRMIMEVLMVRGLGYDKITIFENSQGFLQRVAQLPEKPDVFFLDIHMQPYTGFEMLEMLRQHPDYQSACVIALTASVMNEEVDLLKQSGFNGAIAKPINQMTFSEMLNLILSGEEVWSIS
jgi:CheY-like chemotaxis protein